MSHLIAHLRLACALLGGAAAAAAVYVLLAKVGPLASLGALLLAGAVVGTIDHALAWLERREP
jgi:hypothetical protein